MPIHPEDITARHHGGNSFSTAAHEDVKPRKLNQSARILQALRDRPGQAMTIDEIELLLNIPHQSASARWTELANVGLIAPAGEGVTRTGSAAQAFVAVTDREELKRVAIAARAAKAKRAAEKAAKQSVLRISDIIVFEDESVELVFDTPVDLSYRHDGVIVQRDKTRSVRFPNPSYDLTIQLPR